MRVIFASLTVLAFTMNLAARDNTLSAAESQQGWILLFDGESEFGWTRVGGAQWRVANGTMLADSGAPGYLRTNSPFADFDLKCDFLTKTDGESGIFLRFDKEGDPEDTGYKLQINNHDPRFPTGSLVGQLKASAPPVAPNQWHTYEIEAKGDHFIVRLDGNIVLSGDGHKGRAGSIGLQFVQGTPVAFRNIKLEPLALGPIFNSQTLYQWAEVGGPPPKKKGGLNKLIPGGGHHSPDWSVENGAIHVKKGPSELESSSAYDDFILQLDVQADARNNKEHPTGGVYVRAEKATAGTGYEVQIHNEYRAGDPTRPVGLGIGGLVSVQSARPAVSSDNQYLKLTIAASGHHLATWVNGYQVVDFEDTRPDGPDALIQARTLAGPIRLAADNPSSSLDFKNIDIALLPKAGMPAMAAQTPGGTPAMAQAPISTGAPTAPPASAITPGAPAAPAGNPHQKQIDDLLQQAFVTTDPAKQIELYNKVLLLDNNNQAAISGRNQAQAKLDQSKAQQEQAAQQEAAQAAAAKQQQEQAEANEATKSNEIKQAEAAIIARNWTIAAAHIAIAKKLAPNESKVLDLDARIQNERKAQRFRRWTWIGFASAALGCLVTVLLLNRGKKQPYLEIVDGIHKGKRYRLEQDVIHIGAVAQDGGSKNEIVVTDSDHSISRFHCEIHRQYGKLWVLDCDSANGTYLDGHRVRPEKPALLKKGCRLQLAEACTLRLAFEKARGTNS
jgi:hypothetical protein